MTKFQLLMCLVEELKTCFKGGASVPFNYFPYRAQILIGFVWKMRGGVLKLLIEFGQYR